MINMVMVAGNLPLVLYFGIRKVFVVAVGYYKRAGFYYAKGKEIIPAKLRLFFKIGLKTQKSSQNTDSQVVDIKPFKKLENMLVNK